MNIRRLMIGLLLLGLAGGSWWLTHQAAEPDSVASPARKSDPDYVIEKFVAHAMTERGTRKYVLSAQRLTHYPDTDLAHLIEPVLVQYLPDGVLVTTKGDTGVMPGDGREVVMQGNVRVRRTAASASAGGEILTERLRVELDR